MRIKKTKNWQEYDDVRLPMDEHKDEREKFLFPWTIIGFQGVKNLKLLMVIFPFFPCFLVASTNHWCKFPYYTYHHYMHLYLQDTYFSPFLQWVLKHPRKECVLDEQVMIDALKKPWNRMPVIHISSWKRLLGLDTRPWELFWRGQVFGNCLA